MNDEDLYNQFKTYGKLAKQSQKHFLEMLKEAYKRELHIKMGYDSIYKFADDLAEIEEDIVKTSAHTTLSTHSSGGFFYSGLFFQKRRKYLLNLFLHLFYFTDPFFYSLFH